MDTTGSLGFFALAEAAAAAGASPDASMMEAEVAIVGGGLAGSLLALLLARQGLRPVVVDPHTPYPKDFRCEKLTGEQVDGFAALGVLEALETGGGVRPGAATKFGFRYDQLVNAIRRAWPAEVGFEAGRVAGLETSAGLQRLRLASGKIVQARLVVMATGGGERLRAALGLRRRTIRERHSICIGFNLRPKRGSAFPFQGLVHAGERAGDRIAFASLFPLDDVMRVNLFSYRDVQDAWTRGFRTDPLARLREALPALGRRLGEVEVLGTPEVRSTDLYDSEGVVQPGVVLIGDAFQTSCPATGSGVTRILTDVDRLVRTHVPAWLATEGMGADKIAAFYADPGKQAADSLALVQAERRRDMATRTTPYWRVRRLGARLKQALRDRRESGERAAFVDVRSAAEILATLDADGRIDGLPFMPEMADLCGRRLNVFRRADKTCVEGLGLRRMRRAVLLEDVRCDGGAHDGCERGCMFFWKTAWLRPVNVPAAAVDAAAEAAALERLRAFPTRDGARYICQSTALAGATVHLPKWDYLHLVVDLVRGDLTTAQLGSMLRQTVENRLRRRPESFEFAALRGTAIRPSKGELDLAPGERVRVRDAAAIRATLDASGRNNGLTFEPEMNTHLGGAYRVKGPVTRIIHEETGRMVRLTRTVSLDGVDCLGACMRNCPRRNPLYWREAWLQREDEVPQPRPGRVAA